MQKTIPWMLLTLAVFSGCKCSIPAPNDRPLPEASALPPAVDCLAPYHFTQEEERLLDDLQRRIFDYFWVEVYPETGIAIDHMENRIGKVAATGFELAALCIGVQRGWVSYEDGYSRTLKILNAFWDDPDDPNDPFAEGQFGLYWHFVDGKTGKKEPLDCVAMCDSADFIAGALLVGQYFKGTEVETLARKIYDNVQWDRFVAKKPDGSPDLLSFGWVPLHVSKSFYETDGLLDFNMTGLADNSLLIYALALGSDTHPIPQPTWEQYVDTYTLDDYSGYECVAAGALFCRQVPHAFIPFSRLRDRKIDYFLDTVNALLADRAYNMRVNGYPPQAWGLTDCFGRNSYSHAAPPGPINNDGTIGSTAFAGALPHVPEVSLDAMKYVLKRYGEKTYGRYGFTSSVNLKDDFVSPLYVGIELGPMIMLIENARSGLIWDLFSATPAMSNFVRRARITGVIDDFELPAEAPAYAVWTVEGSTGKAGDFKPQSGRKCFEIRSSTNELTITARLTENNLLAYDFGSTLSVWTRDLSLTDGYVVLNGEVVPLESVGEIAGGPWVNTYFQMPEHKKDAALCGLVLYGKTVGSRPALDNLSLEREADLDAPTEITDLKAASGALGGSVELAWTAAGDAGSDEVGRYRVLAGMNPDLADAREFEFLPAQPPGGKEKQTLFLEGGKKYHFAISALDRRGHQGPWSKTVEATTNPKAVDRRIMDFESGNISTIGNPNSNWTLHVVSGDGGKWLQVDYQKTHAWNFLEFPVDSQLQAAHRYLVVRVKGKVTLLGKLWCRHTLQQDIEILHSDSDDTWTTLKFDMRKSSLATGGEGVRKVLFFIEPGRKDGQGTFFLDDLSFSNE